MCAIPASGIRMAFLQRGTLGLGLAVVLAFIATSLAQGDDLAQKDILERNYPREVQPVLARYCSECHSAKRAEADIDLTALGAFDHARKQTMVWQKVAEMLDTEQMPPPDEKQLSAAEKASLQRWVKQLLTLEAAASAGDPGPVVLRRLSNVEYTYTLRDLTGVATLDPAKEFPVDSAAGEGFTNVGNALSMSPTMLTKYLDAAKNVTSHATLLPDGMRFSPGNSRRDWTDEQLAKIRHFYNQYSSADGGSAVNLQGVQFKTNQGGRLPVLMYLKATLEEREALAKGQKSFATVAQERGLNAKYLETLWRALQEPAGTHATPMDALRAAWKTAQPADAPALAANVSAWQNALWKFNSVGQYNRNGGSGKWMDPVSPLVTRQDFRVKMPATATGDVVVYLSSNSLGDASGGDAVVWERPRFVMPGRPELMLKDVRRVAHALTIERNKHIAQVAACLKAAAEASMQTDKIDTAALAKKHQIDAKSLSGWFAYLGVGVEGSNLGTPITGKAESGAGYDFIKGWTGADALSVLANSSDQTVRIPGTMKPHSIAVHPAPKFSVAVGWRSPQAAMLKISGTVQHAHPECGNGIAWALELRRGGVRQRLAAGNSQGAKEIAIGPIEKIRVNAGDVVALVIDPRDNEHSCDLTQIDLTIHDGKQEWNLAREVSPNILAGNPHADAFGNKDVWHFYSNITGGSGASIPAGSLLAKWQTAVPDEQTKLAQEVQRLLHGESKPAPGSADAALYEQLTSLSGPLILSALQSVADEKVEPAEDGQSSYGLASSHFGKVVQGKPIDANSLCLMDDSAVEFRVPAVLVAGSEFVTSGTLHQELGKNGSVQLQVATSPPAKEKLLPGLPIIVGDESASRKKLEAALEEFRQLFPAALCYTQIVPVDEVVTLTLFFREDDHLQRLMLSEEDKKQLNQHWDELFYIAQEPLQLVTAYEQLVEFATQDRPDLAEPLAKLRQPILERAAAFQERLVASEPAHVDAIVRFANQAYRRPLTTAEEEQLRSLYATLRKQELSHEDAFRLTLARVLVAPAFLYRLERPGDSNHATPVSDWELASRLSYFLWSSQPDADLRSLAAAGKLRDPDILAAQAKRMLQDPKARRLATEFACQWLDIYDFDRHDEKSEQFFPTFAGLRGAMYEESIQFFTDLFQHDRSVLNILDADYTYLNEALAAHYGIPNIQGAQWRRVEGVKQHGRGGILTQATVLSKQAGASRTSPILRGNWLSEVVLGEKLPRPPKDVPVLADTIPAGLSERQLIERHSSDAACAKCHKRIDPFGFALESYDAIGRYREKDAAGLAINAKTTAPDGVAIDGLPGLRDYLLKQRQQAFVRQFNKKLLGYALGRAVQLSDEPLLTEMQAALAKNNFRVATTVELVVRSPQFRNIRGRQWLTE